ncbi:hypothetical protein I79_012979 [Cricetulus griseus]|uniref:Uncharacterized protein n=1 Tax=Cricetulus griseus TaxID=10029 RepID=G3HQ84_CRIGR|nr:hypothetical protein I79_012979 [Cricetulus griseus]
MYRSFGHCLLLPLLTPGGMVVKTEPLTSPVSIQWHRGSKMFPLCCRKQSGTVNTKTEVASVEPTQPTG